MSFVNRKKELALLQRSVTNGGLVVIFGRRRIGKTALVEKFGSNLDKIEFMYSQAVEGAETLQISQLVEDFRKQLPEGVVPRTWPELFAALSLVHKPSVVAIDEFPYLCRGNPSLPSLLQKWLDHKKPKNMSLLLLGSSQTMMSQLFLSGTAPLFQRATLELHLLPMHFQNFCEATGLDGNSLESFCKFAITGGIPKYWFHIDRKETVTQMATRLYFDKASPMENEPDRLLKDEDIQGVTARSLLEAIGRGASRPSEIASRLGTKQTTLSKPLQILLKTGMIQKLVPFGQNPKSSKQTNYQIADGALAFWYRVFSPHRSRWHLYPESKQTELIQLYASQMLERAYRDCFPDGMSYWEGDKMEFDVVRHASSDGKKILISEIKWKQLSEKQKESLNLKIREKFAVSKLAKHFQLAEVEVLGGSEVLSKLLRQT